MSSQGARASDRSAHAAAPVLSASHRILLVCVLPQGLRWRRRSVRLRQVEGAPAERGQVQEEDFLQGCRRNRRGEGGGAGDRRVPEEPGEILQARRQDSEGRPSRGPARNGQDASRQGDSGRGEGALLLNIRFGLRGDVRRSGRKPRARHVRSRQEVRALPHLHRRDRRRRR